ncbi:MAG: ATP-binding protein [Chloroflexota bacterium]
MYETNEGRPNPFRRATKSQAKLRMAIMGPSGSGKTFTSLSVAGALGKVAVIDTEHGSASKYGDRFTFDVLELTDYHPQQYIDAIQAAGASDAYDVLVIDSLSHAWNGTGGVLEIVDKAAKRSDSKNTFAAWRDATPLHNQLVEALLSVPLHLITTMRSKTEYVLERDERGRMTPRKVGLAPVQREGMEYEFDVVAEMDMQNTLVVSKTRIPKLTGKVIPQPGAALGETLKAWLNDGTPLHWAKDGGGQRFNARMKALRELGALHLTPEYILTLLEEDRPLEKLSDTRLTEAEALDRLEYLAQSEEQTEF